MSIRQSCAFYDMSKATPQNWLKEPRIKLTHNKPPSKTPNEVLLKDVKRYLEDYIYDKAPCFNFSRSGIEAALKRIGISQKKDLSASKSMSSKKSGFEAETIRSHCYAYIGALASIAITGKVKNETTPLVVFTKRCSLLCITLSKTSIKIYFMTGTNTH